MPKNTDDSHYRRHSHTVELRVRYAETDQMGFAYHGNFVTWMEVGRVELLRAYGHSYAEMEKKGFLLAVREVRIVYHAPAHYDDVIAMTTRLAHMGKTRMTFESAFRRRDDDTLLAEGSVTVFCVTSDGKLTKIPAYIRELADGEARGEAGASGREKDRS
jgi:acyl-CoA thioester hydrolase